MGYNFIMQIVFSGVITVIDYYKLLSMHVYIYVCVYTHTHNMYAYVCIWSFYVKLQF